jgi:nitrous oxidase accessory protein NosD
MPQLRRLYQGREGDRRMLPLEADSGKALAVQKMTTYKEDTDSLMLTGSSRASEVAKEKGSMVDIHLPQLVVVGEGVPEAL